MCIPLRVRVFAALLAISLLVGTAVAQTSYDPQDPEAYGGASDPKSVDPYAGDLDSTATTSPPRATSSFYMRTIEQQDHYNRGCALGTRDRDLPGTQDRLVILSYGRPRYVVGSYGASLFKIEGFASITAIRGAAQEFGGGTTSVRDRMHRRP